MRSSRAPDKRRPPSLLGQREEATLPTKPVAVDIRALCKKTLIFTTKFNVTELVTRSAVNIHFYSDIHKCVFRLDGHYGKAQIPQFCVMGCQL